MKQKIYLILACLFCFSMVQAQIEHNIHDGSVTITTGGSHHIFGYGTPTTNTIIVYPGVKATITLENVNIDVSGIENACAFNISSGANIALILPETNTLKSNGNAAGLQVNESATLTIEDESNSNRLTVYGEAKAAENITINGGIITATGSTGAGYQGDGGVITINGGEITAICESTDWGAAAIGGGSDGSNDTYDGGEAGCITINGRNVTAQGGSYCAGIGSGYTPKNGHSNGIITITGGTVNATGGASGAGIGSGDDGNGVLLPSQAAS